MEKKSGAYCFTGLGDLGLFVEEMETGFSLTALHYSLNQGEKQVMLPTYVKTIDEALAIVTEQIVSGAFYYGGETFGESLELISR